MANDLQASNVPGIGEDSYSRGAHRARLSVWPLPGCAAMIALASHRNQCCIGINIDPAAITDTERFGRCLAAGFAEVLALHPGANPVRRV